jgi:hypothetical protein
MKRVRELCTKKVALRRSYAKIFKAPIPQSLVLARELRLNDPDDISKKNTSISSTHF